MVSIIKLFPKIFVTSELMKISKALAYMSFSIKELFEYVNSKGPDETNLTLVRNAPSELAKYKELYDKLNKVLEENGVE